MADSTEKFCRYSMVKIDSELVGPARGVAYFSNKTLQEWLSDLVNEAIAKDRGTKPIKRKPPKPRPKKKDD